MRWPSFPPTRSSRSPSASCSSYAASRTYAALRAELGEHPAITAAQMGHTDPRMTLRVYTDVTGKRPQTRMAGLLGDGRWALANDEHDDGADAAGGEQAAS